VGRKPKRGLREAILAEAAEHQSSATMIREALEAKYGIEPASLTGVIKAAEGLRVAGLLEASQAMPEVYRGARPRTYYTATPKGKASLKNTIAAATAGWNATPSARAAQPAERPRAANPQPKARPRKET
jgi:DNA-binding PadR family transcriptional regulator